MIPGLPVRRAQIDGVVYTTAIGDAAQYHDIALRITDDDFTWYCGPDECGGAHPYADRTLACPCGRTAGITWAGEIPGFDDLPDAWSSRDPTDRRGLLQGAIRACQTRVCVRAASVIVARRLQLASANGCGWRAREGGDSARAARRVLARL